MANNKHRNEIDIVLGVETYTLRATFSALVEVENVVGMSILAYIQKVEANHNVMMEDAHGIILAGIKGAGGDIDPDDLEASMVEEGTAGSAGSAVSFLVLAIHGGKVFEEESKKK
jgi:hypothetical protein